MKPAERVIEKFGGLYPMARALGHRYPSTVQGWKDRGYIPGQQIPKVIKAATELGIVLDLDDFNDFEEVPSQAVS